MKWGQTTFFEAIEDSASPEEAYADSDGRIQREVFVVPGTHQAKEQAKCDFLGTNIVVGALSTTGKEVSYLSRTSPHPYATYTATDPNGRQVAPMKVPFAYCVSIPRIRGVGVGRINAEGLTDYDQWRMTLTYSILPWRVLADFSMRATAGPLQGFPDESQQLASALGTLKPSRYISVNAQMGGKFTVLRAGMMQYVVDNGTVPEGSAVSETWMDVLITWHRVPEDGIPWNAIANCMGAVNQGNWFLFNKETLLCLVPQIRLQPDSWGVPMADIQYHFRWKPNVAYVDVPAGSGVFPQRGHNWFLRVVNKTLDYYEVRSNGSDGGQHPYRSVDFSALFRPDQPPGP